MRLEQGKGWRYCGCRPEGIDAVLVTCPECGSLFWLRGYKVVQGKVMDVECGNPLCEFEADLELIGFNHADTTSTSS